MLYIVKNIDGTILDTNIKEGDIVKGILECTSEGESVFCPQKKRNRRQARIIGKSTELYLCSYDTDITRRIFNHYINSARLLVQGFENSLRKSNLYSEKKFRRLRHNLIAHSTNIYQELHRLLPPDRQIKKVDTVDNIISSNTRNAAFSFLKILKSSNLLKVEFDVHELIYDSNPYLDLTSHTLHKIVTMCLMPFWLDFQEYDINIDTGSYYGNVEIDYKSISVVLTHTFDNMVKYILPHSDLIMDYEDINGKVKLTIDMDSLTVEPDEVEKIFEDNYSGRAAEAIGLNGEGFGMYLIKKLMELNKGEVHFEANVKDGEPFLYEGSPYCANRMIFVFKKV